MELQRGQERAGYGDAAIAFLSEKMTERYGAGWSKSNLWYLRQFYSTYANRGFSILHTVCGESTQVPESMKEFRDSERQCFEGDLDFPLSWSHYRALMRVRYDEARSYYEGEAVAGNWSVRQLERQIQTRCYERLVGKMGRRSSAEKSVAPAPGVVLESVNITPPIDGHRVGSVLDTLKDPYVLEFLDIPDPAAMHESGLEGAIIAHLRDFLLELGKGFAFVARQKRLSFEDQHLYVDLVFYSIPLRCYLLIDLKTGKLTSADVGQMDSYVLMFDDLVAGSEDNPTIGLILCTEHNSAVAKYSVLNDRRQIFASRYMTCLPTESELAAEIQRTRALLEARKSGE